MCGRASMWPDCTALVGSNLAKWICGRVTLDCDAPALTSAGLRPCRLRRHLHHVLPHRRDLAWRAVFTPLFEAPGRLFKVRQEARVGEHRPPLLDDRSDALPHAEELAAGFEEEVF